MRSVKQILAVAAAALVLGSMPAAGQDPDVRELERRLRELREEMQDLSRQLARQRADAAGVVTRGPRVMTVLANQAQLGVYVRMRPDEETDAVGAELESVVPDSPADEAGLRAGDIITSFNGESLVGDYPDADEDESHPAARLIDLVREGEAGDDVEIEYQREGRSYSTTATLGESRGMPGMFSYRFGDEPTAGVLSQPRRLELLRMGEDNVISFFAGPWSHMELVTLNEDLGRYFGTSEGLLVIQPPDEEGLDLRSGDVILSIGGRDPRSPSRALRIMRSYEPGETMNLEIMRDRQRMTVSVDVPEAGWARDGDIRIDVRQRR